MHYSPLSLQNRARHAITTVETAVAVLMLGLILTTTLSVYAVAARAGDRNRYETELVGGARIALDEALGLIRSASKVHGLVTIDGADYVTGPRQIVLSAPGYNPSSAEYFLSGVSDYIILRYDPQTKTIVETLIPGSGSVRPARSNMVLVRNVESCSFRHVVREFFSGAGNNQKFTLSAVGTGTPVIYLNGQIQTGLSLHNNTFTLNLTAKQNDVQVVYEVSPDSDNTKMALVGNIELSVVLSTTDSRQLTVRNRLDGAARLRNARK